MSRDRIARTIDVDKLKEREEKRFQMTVDEVDAHNEKIDAQERGERWAIDPITSHAIVDLLETGYKPTEYQDQLIKDLVRAKRKGLQSYMVDSTIFMPAMNQLSKAKMDLNQVLRDNDLGENAQHIKFAIALYEFANSVGNKLMFKYKDEVERITKMGNREYKDWVETEYKKLFHGGGSGIQPVENIPEVFDEVAKLTDAGVIFNPTPGATKYAQVFLEKLEMRGKLWWQKDDETALFLIHVDRESINAENNTYAGATATVRFALTPETRSLIGKFGHLLRTIGAPSERYGLFKADTPDSGYMHFSHMDSISEEPFKEVLDSYSDKWVMQVSVSKKSKRVTIRCVGAVEPG